MAAALKDKGGPGRVGPCAAPEARPAALAPQRRAALLALTEDEAVALLDADDAEALALAEEFALAWSKRVGDCLKEGRDYLELLSPKPDTPALEAMAMEAVLEAVEAQLAKEDV